MTSWKKLNIGIFALLLSMIANAQQFHYRSNLDTVTNTGFYAITITPELSSHLKTDFSDFRVADKKGRWVPHLIRFVSTGGTGVQMINLKMSSVENLGTNTVILIENPEKNLLNEFILRLKNAAAERMASLSGSEDNKKWFIIADSLLVSRPDSYNRDENLKLITLPPTEYSHYKLTIRNDRKDPLNVLAISSNISITPGSENLWVQNPTPEFSQVDSGKLTLIKVTHDKPYQFDQFRFGITRPALYDRVVRVFLEVKPGLINTWESRSIAEIKLSSGNLHKPVLPLVKAKTFYIMISNQDNPPLEINAVNTFQRSKQAITFLEKNNAYHLLLENAAAEQPEYDLKEFDKTIPEKPQSLQASQAMAISNPVVASTKKPGDWWIWATIGGVILVLAYLTWGLTKDMNKKKEVV
jgi:hypothetical protein